MISCTDFIPLYNEFFKYIDARGGYEAVQRYWTAITEKGCNDPTNPNSLRSFLEREPGFWGAVHYWEHTLSEESSDVIKIYDLEKKTIAAHMRRCPSKGHLLDYPHITPYEHYCEHCWIYKPVLNMFGLDTVRDHSAVDKGECRSIVFEKGTEPDWEEAFRITPEKKIWDIRPSDNKYLHRDFHLSGDRCLAYCGEKYGDNGVDEFLRAFTKAYFGPMIAKIRTKGLSVLEEYLIREYETEEAPEVLHTSLDGEGLIVTVDRSPVISYMRSLNQEPSKYYIEETRTVYAEIADETGYGFSLDYYHEDGGCRFRIFRRTF